MLDSDLKQGFAHYTGSLDDFSVKVDHSRDSLLTDFGKSMLHDRYLMTGAQPQDLFSRVASYYADDKKHAQRLYDYMSKLWFMPATPILSNGGTNRGLPISCFLNEVHDSLASIVDIWNENIWLASKGGGIGTFWGNVRGIGEKVRDNGRTSGIIPFIAVQDRLTLAISQGSLRRGSSAVYLPISHPEIEEFIELRRPIGGDPNRKAMNLHHGVVITNDFMEAVLNDGVWELKSPKDGKVMHRLRARDLWIRVLIARIEIGEPYILFIDHVNDAKPETYRKLGLEVKTSNLCSEITLATGTDQLGQERTAVCCLSSLNLEKYDEWKDDQLFILDIMKFLDNVLQDFINRAPDTQKNAVYAASRERSVGLGVMGFHSFLQAKNVPIESVTAKAWNKKIFSYIKEEADKASIIIAQTKGPCPDAADVGIMERFSHKIAIAPTASISVIAGN
jgi:ribonucleoside-diphosphate reductase alpha chain